MANKEELQKMLDALVDNNDEQAQTTFHSYLADKMKDILHPGGDSVKNEETKKAE